MNIKNPKEKFPIQSISDFRLVSMVAIYAVTFIVFGFIMSSPSEIFMGLLKIMTVRDALITDYIGVGGMGAAFVNAGLLTLIACIIYRLTKAQISGASVACLFLLLGFGLFGKNLLNVWPIVIGVFLYAKFKQEPLALYLNTAFFGCALAPIVSEILYASTLPIVVSIPLALVTGLVLGFVLPPVAKHLFKTHAGFNLYNMGFTAGVVGSIVIAFYKSYNLIPDPVMIWTSGNDLVLAILLLFLLISTILGGIYLDRRGLAKLNIIFRLSGQTPTDFINEVGIGTTLINMGLSGLIGLAYLLLVKADLNGPTLGGIFTIVGFAAFGKHPKNIIPIMVGVFIASLAKPWNASDASITLTALFGTSLAPIAGRFGWHWGIVAGFIHSSAALSISSINAGLNLYSNGFAAGIVAAVLVPILLAIKNKDG